MYNRARNILPGNHVGQWNLRSHLRMFNKNKLEYFRRMFSFFCFVLFIQISFPQSYFSIHKGTVTAFKGFKIFNNLPYFCFEIISVIQTPKLFPHLSCEKAKDDLRAILFQHTCYSSLDLQEYQLLLCYFELLTFPNFHSLK